MNPQDARVVFRHERERALNGDDIAVASSKRRDGDSEGIAIIARADSDRPIREILHRNREALARNRGELKLRAIGNQGIGEGHPAGLAFDR